MSVKNAFLHGDPKEELYMKLPPRVNGSSKDEVCGLRRSLYGLKQTPHAWFEKFRETFHKSRFAQSKNDSSMLLRRSSSGITVLVCVYDISIT